VSPAATDARYLRALPEHSERLAALMRRCFLHAYHHASTPERIARFVDQTYAPQRLYQELCKPSLPTWIALDEHGEWAGFGRLCLDSTAHPAVQSERPLELQRFYLAPEHHGRGLAAPLMAFFIAQARALEADALWLNVWQEAPQAIRFYQKQGFTTVGTTVFWVDDDPKDDWVMHRVLAADRA
jgi:GNAT superfamily N-acetyltransferase